MSVRISQLLVAVVLALLAIALFRTASAYQEQIVAAQVRMRGAAIIERETRRLGARIAAIEGLAAQTALEGSGFSLTDFADRARTMMNADPAVMAVDFFNADDQHVLHVAPGVAANPSRSGRRAGAHVSRADVQAIERAMFDAALSRATALADVPAPNTTPTARAIVPHFYLATRVVRHETELGTIVAYLDARRLLTDDIARRAPDAFEVHDAFGRSLEPPLVPLRGQPDVQRFPLPFADRVLQMTLGAPPHIEVRWWWFALGWLAVVVAIVLPMEAVGNINRRVQTLNEELETRVAARTRQLETSLEESRRLAVVVESVHEGVMAIGASGFIRYVNAALCRELLYAPSTFVDRPLTDVPALGIGEQLLADIRAGIGAKGYVYREMERTRADGSRYTAGVTFARHALEGSDAIVAVSRDVSERRRLMDELVAAKGSLERDRGTRADFIATASHELRTPVTTLRTLAALLLEKLRSGALNDEGRLLEVLDRETGRLATLVDDLLKIARIDAPQPALEEQPLDLCVIVEAVVADVQRFGGGPAVALHCPSAPVVVSSDAEALRSVMANVIGNARKFTPAGGRVDVSVERHADRARLTVADTGVGIAAADLPHIFERFFRAPRTASKAAGAGLGLAIVARLVELGHGSVSVASELGHGTTVTIDYPLAMHSANLAVGSG